MLVCRLEIIVILFVHIYYMIKYMKLKRMQQQIVPKQNTIIVIYNNNKNQADALCTNL